MFWLDDDEPDPSWGTVFEEYQCFRNHPVKSISSESRTVEQAATESTCLKRVTVCEILDANRNVLACESNRCSPPDGKCCRMGLVSVKDGYPEYSSCRWTHAEEMSINSLPPESQPVVAVVYGHG